MPSDPWVSSFLDNPKLIVEPRLAIMTTDHLAIVCRRMHDLVQDQTANVHGERWVYRTFEHWSKKEFTWLNENTIRTMLTYELGQRATKRRGTRQPMDIIKTRRADARGCEFTFDYGAFARFVRSPGALAALQEARGKCRTFHRQRICPPDIKCAEYQEYLLDDSQIAVHPVMIEILGVTPTILLRQLRLGLQFGDDFFGEDRPYITCTIDQWQGLCPWLCNPKTISDGFTILKDRGLVISKRHKKLPGLFYAFDEHGFCALTRTDEFQAAHNRFEEFSGAGMFSRSERAQTEEKSPVARAHNSDVGPPPSTERARSEEKSPVARAQQAESAPPSPTERAQLEEKSPVARAQQSESTRPPSTERAQTEEKSPVARAQQSESIRPPSTERAQTEEKSPVARAQDSASPYSYFSSSSEEEQAKRKLFPPEIWEPTLTELLGKSLADIQDAKAVWDKKPAYKRDFGLLISWIRNAAKIPEIVELRRRRAASLENGQKIQAQKVQAREEEHQLQNADRATEAIIARLSDEQLLARAQQVLEKYRGNTAVSGTLTRKPPRECRLMKLEIVALIQAGQTANQVNP